MSAAIAEHGKTLGSVRVDVQGLQVRLAGTRTNVVDDVSFQVRDGELLGLVGESGSGKTTIALTLLGHTRRGLEITAGRVMMNGIDMATASAREANHDPLPLAFTVHGQGETCPVAWS